MIVINGKAREVPNIESTNYLDGVEPHLFHKPRKKQIQHIVIHETAGISGLRCKRTLEHKNYGIHLILHRKGNLSCHCDLASEITRHAGQLNGTSIGIEIVNPYYPFLSKHADYKTKIVEKKWWTHTPKGKHPKGYILPSEAQLNTIRVLIPWLCKELNIPYKFPTWRLGPKQRRIKNWSLRTKPEPGVIAHRDFSKHSDGRYILNQLIIDAFYVDPEMFID